MQSSSMTLNRLIGARRAIWRDFATGFLSVARKAIALAGIATLTLMVAMVARPDLREMVWAAALDARIGPALAAAVADESSGSDSSSTAAAAPASVIEPGHEFDLAVRHAGMATLSREQHAAATFLARKYRLAPDAIAYLVTEAFSAGKEFKVDPLLILAVMSIESSMNPFAQSNVGAQGLMQVMTTVHAERFDEFGGLHAALNPTVNIRVGTEILKELIDREGSIEGGLKAYVGATLHPDDGGYGSRVLVERARLESAVTGRPLVLPASLQQAGDDMKTQGMPVSFSTGVKDTSPVLARPPFDDSAAQAGV